ncbi:hypothetical protein [Mycolicibacterium setense]|uniref:hypothetical protein n=1 Tax=Mycolicibacterium setense TaxID=431269 RepID=UPI000574FD9D|nr:hypothetical protein [Mycolicibacterium setense]KHO21815.1 hypothetical protein QQ25_15070 [Mycolicibacterium setense]MCV7114016.1 hypothetical protein [Mycolicibacterium setense]
MSTFTLSVLGVVLAVIANVWNFALTFVRWPRVAVETRTHMVVVVGGQNRDRIELTVINRGAEAVTVSNIGLRPMDPSLMPCDYALDEVLNPKRLPQGEQLPIRVEGHGAVKWTYTREQFVGIRQDTKVTGYAMTYRSFRWPWLRGNALTERTISARRTETVRL